MTTPKHATGSPTRWTAVHRTEPVADGTPEERLEWLLREITSPGRDVHQRRYDLDALAQLVIEDIGVGYGSAPIDHDVHPEDCTTCHGIDHGPVIYDGHTYRPDTAA